MKRMSRRRPFVIALVVGLCLLAAALLVKWAYTPTVEAFVLNDSGQTVSVSACADDPLTITPGHEVAIDPNRKDPRSACLIYDSNTRYVGCLVLGSIDHTGERFFVSSRNISTAESACGD